MTNSPLSPSTWLRRVRAATTPSSPRAAEVLVPGMRLSFYICGGAAAAFNTMAHPVRPIPGAWRRRGSAQRVAERPPVSEALGEAQEKDALACGTLHLGGVLGQRRAETSARTHVVARSALDRQVDRVVGTLDDGPHIRAHRHDFQRVAWHAAGTLGHVEPSGVRRETHDLIPGAAPHAQIHVARHAGPGGHVRHGLPSGPPGRAPPAPR